jgi:hypothetical protein
VYVCILCMYICMYVCVYVCIFVCMYVCMHVCMYACMFVCMYVFPLGRRQYLSAPLRPGEPPLAQPSRSRSESESRRLPGPAGPTLPSPRRRPYPSPVTGSAAAGRGGARRDSAHCRARRRFPSRRLAPGPGRAPPPARWRSPGLRPKTQVPWPRLGLGTVASES